MTSIQPQHLSSVHEDEKTNSNYYTREKLRSGALLSDNEPEKTLFNNEPKKSKTQSQSSKLLRNSKDLRTFNDSPLTKNLKRDTFQKDSGFLMTNKSTPKKHWPSERSPIKYTEAYRNLLESDVYGKSVKEIEAENYALRKALKDMNEELQRAIEKVKMVDLVGKRQEFRDKNPEDKLRTIIRELANNEQIIAINEEEARKVEARIEGIKDGDYLYKVQQEIRDIKKQTEKIHKENKKLEIKNDETGKNLDILENVKGNPSSVEEIHAKQDELMSLKEKNNRVKEKKTNQN